MISVSNVTVSPLRTALNNSLLSAILTDYFYHGFLVGLLEYSDDYEVLSNRENGTGRSDIVIKDIITYRKAVIIEVEKQYEVNLKFDILFIIGINPQKTEIYTKSFEKHCNTAFRKFPNRYVNFTILHSIFGIYEVPALIQKT